ncbi:alpha/beta fold hydrolase [Streptomyces sp. NPDC051572]|uniref:thioesterase II family protein n=1 Tax=Streptomyces sp. NPDC051572 TaxID=3155802 RepID=UPI00344F4246
MNGSRLRTSILGQSDRILLRPAATGRPRYRLICLHHAGGGAAAYVPWFRRIAADVEVCVIRLPGRESRWREPAHLTVTAAVAEILDVVGPLAVDDVPMALYGHSMGGVLAYETYSALTRQGAPEPLFLAMGATPSPLRQVERAPRLAAGYGRGDLVDVLRDYRGTPPEVFEQQDLLDIVLPVLEADLLLLDAYQPALPPRPVRCPLVAFAGSCDPLVAADDTAAWRDCAAGAFEHRLLDGGHFFLQSHMDTVLDRLEEWSREVESSR